ncbi:hypothetical protein Sjap_018478 [Stephania japonica]|uniref:Uncharacterized protein n=1 Tax=Stephania japonica TaxID=461633 RepID=A0AAP0I897_9MAGN
MKAELTCTNEHGTLLVLSDVGGRVIVAWVMPGKPSTSSEVSSTHINNDLTTATHEITSKRLNKIVSDLIKGCEMSTNVRGEANAVTGTRLGRHKAAHRSTGSLGASHHRDLGKVVDLCRLHHFYFSNYRLFCYVVGVAELYGIADRITMTWRGCRRSHQALA